MRLLIKMQGKVAIVMSATVVLSLGLALRLIIQLAVSRLTTESYLWGKSLCDLPWDQWMVPDKPWQFSSWQQKHLKPKGKILLSAYKLPTE